MQDTITTVCLTLLTLLSAAAWAIMSSRLGRDDRPRQMRRAQYALLGTCTTGSVLLLVYRTIFVNEGWYPLQAHVDGLLLMAVLLAAATLFLQTGRRLPEFSGFALPLLTFLLLWSICASWWTHQPFDMTTVWKTFHRAVVYLGTLSVSVAAAAGGMYLHVRRRLRRKADLAAPGRFASLEAIERLITSASVLGFALISLGLATGLISHVENPGDLGARWWLSPHILLPLPAWVIYGLLMNLRFASTFRGRRAAWLSIIGLVLLMMTLGAALRAAP